MTDQTNANKALADTINEALIPFDLYVFSTTFDPGDSIQIELRPRECMTKKDVAEWGKRMDDSMNVSHG